MATLEVNLVGDSRSLERAYSRSAQATKRFESQITRTGRSIGGALAAAAGVSIGFAGAVAGIKSVVNASSNLSESLSKNSAVFKDSAGIIETWSQTTARAFGVSQREAVETASTFGALFGPLGIVGRNAAQQSRKLTELGADLASFYNTDVASALDAIRSGLVGEAEPLRRYGVLLSETRVQEEALRETHKKHATDLTVQEKALARLELIYRDTSVAQGDFSRTSGGLAGQQKILTAQIEDLKAAIGDQLKPEIIKALKATNDWLGEPGNREKVIQGMASAVVGLGKAFQFTADRIGDVSAAWDKLPDFGKDKGLLDLIDRLPGGTNMSLLDLLGAKTDLFPSGGGDSSGVFSDLARAISTKFPELRRITGAANDTGRQSSLLAQVFAAADATTGPAKGKGKTTTKAGIDVSQMNNWFDAMINRQLGRVQDIPTLKGQIRRLGQIADLVRARMAATSDVTRRLTLEDKLLDIVREQRGDRAQLAEKARADATTREGTKMQWLQFAVERAEATKPIKDDVKAQRAIETELQRLIKIHGHQFDLVSELWRTRKRIRDLTKKNANVDPLAGLMQVSSKRLAGMLAAGTGLDVAGRRRLRYNIAGAEIRPLVIPVNIDGREIGRATMREQARTGNRTGNQTSGRRG